MSEELTIEEADDYFLTILESIIRGAYERKDPDVVSTALIRFRVRVTNSWQSIRTLRKHTPDQRRMMVDAATLLRAMFDACFQAEFIFRDPPEREGRAKLYLDFEHVERYQMKNKVMQHDNPLKVCVSQMFPLILAFHFQLCQARPSKTQGVPPETWSQPLNMFLRPILPRRAKHPRPSGPPQPKMRPPGRSGRRRVAPGTPP